MTQRLKRKSRAATQDEPEDVEEGARASRAKVAKRDKAPAKRERRESEVEAGGGRGGRASARAARAAPAAPTTVNLVDEDEDEDEFDVKPEIGFEQLVRASRARRRRLPRGASSRVVRRVPSFSSIGRPRTNERSSLTSPSRPPGSNRVFVPQTQQYQSQLDVYDTQAVVQKLSAEVRDVPVRRTRSRGRV